MYAASDENQVANGNVFQFIQGSAAQLNFASSGSGATQEPEWVNACCLKALFT